MKKDEAVALGRALDAQRSVDRLAYRHNQLLRRSGQRLERAKAARDLAVTELSKATGLSTEDATEVMRQARQHPEQPTPPSQDEVAASRLPGGKFS